MNDSTLEQKSPAEIWEFFLNDDRFMAVISLAGIASLFLFVLNLFHLGGNHFVQGLNTVVAFAAAMLTMFLALLIRERLKDTQEAELLWLAISMGLGWWSFLETIRLFLFFISPAPRFSVLNWLWVFGYLPLFYGVSLRHTSLEQPMTNRQRRLRWSVTGLGGVYIMAVLLIPLLTGRAPGIGGGLAGLVCALADLGLLFLLGRIVLAYWGQFGGPWKFLVLAFAIKLLGETVIQFPANLGTGFPLSIANFFHYGWYGIAALGLFAYHWALTIQFQPQQPVMVKEDVSPNASALIFTDEQDNVIKTSINFRYVMRLPNSMTTTGTPLHKALGISDAVYQDFKAQVRRQGNTKKYMIEPDYFRAGNKAWVTAIASLDQQRRYNGLDLVVQVMAGEMAGAELTSEERALVENIFYLSGTAGEESKKLLISYFNVHYRMLSGLAVKYEGSRRAAGLSNRVNQVAKKQNLSVRVLEQEINAPENVTLEELGRSISILLAAAREYMSGLAGMETVMRETERLHHETGRSTRDLIQKYNLGKMG